MERNRGGGHRQRIGAIDCLNRMMLVRILFGVIEFVQLIAFIWGNSDRNGSADGGGLCIHAHTSVFSVSDGDGVGDCLEGGGDSDSTCRHSECVIFVECYIFGSLFDFDGTEFITRICIDGKCNLVTVLRSFRCGYGAICGLYGDLVVSYLEGKADDHIIVRHGKVLLCAVAMNINFFAGRILCNGNGIQRITSCGGNL